MNYKHSNLSANRAFDDSDGMEYPPSEHEYTQGENSSSQKYLYENQLQPPSFSKTPATSETKYILHEENKLPHHTKENKINSKEILVNNQEQGDAYSNRRPLSANKDKKRVQHVEVSLRNMDLKQKKNPQAQNQPPVVNYPSPAENQAMRGLKSNPNTQSQYPENKSQPFKSSKVFARNKLSQDVYQSRDDKLQNIDYSAAPSFVKSPGKLQANTASSYNSRPVSSLPQVKNLEQADFVELARSGADFRYLFEDLTQKYIQIEESLRRETLNSEEQRSYIEILKQALEGKLYEGSLIQQTFNGKKALNVDFYLESVTLRKNLQEKAEENSVLIGQIEEHEEKISKISQYNEELAQIQEKLTVEKDALAQEKESITKELSEVMDTLNLANNENNKLAEEKESLLEYLQEMKDNIIVVQEENEKFAENMELLEKEREEMESQIKEMAEENKNKASQLRASNEELEALRVLSDEIEKQRQNLLKKHGETQAELTLTKEKCDRIQNELETNKIVLQEKTFSNENLSRSLKEANSKLDDYREQLQIAKENVSTLTTTLNETQNDLDKIFEKSAAQENHIKNSDAKIRSYESNTRELVEKLDYLEGVEERKNELEQIANELQEEVNMLNETLNEGKARFDKERAQKAEEIKNLYEQISSSRSEIREIKEEVQMLRLEKQTMLETLENAKEQSLRNKSALAAANKEIKEYKKILDEREMDSAKLHTLSLRYQADVEHYEKEIRDLEEKLKNFNRNKENLSEDLKELQEENALLFETNREMEKKLNELMKKESSLNLRVSTMQSTIETSIKNVNLIIAQLRRSVTLSGRSGKLLTFPKRHNEKNELENSLEELDELVSACIQDNEIINKRLLEQEETFKEERDLYKEQERKLASFIKDEGQAKDQLKALKSENAALMKERENTFLNRKAVYQKDNTLERDNQHLISNMEKLKQDNTRLITEANHWKIEYENLLDRMEKNLLKEDESVRKELQLLQENVTQIKSEKATCDYIFKKFKSLIPDETLVRTLDEAVSVNLEISNLERERTDLQVKIENLANQMTAGDGNLIENRRKLEGMKEKLRDVINDHERMIGRKRALENEMSQMEIREKRNYEKSKEIEKQNQAFRTEISSLKNEMEIKRMTRKPSETQTKHEYTTKEKSGSHHDQRDVNQILGTREVRSSVKGRLSNKKEESEFERPTTTEGFHVNRGSDSILSKNLRNFEDREIPNYFEKSLNGSYRSERNNNSFANRASGEKKPDNFLGKRSELDKIIDYKNYFTESSRKDNKN